MTAGGPPLLDALLRTATRHTTAGGIVWHRWGEGPRDLVLLHGGAGSWMHWARNLQALARHFRLWVPDLPGMGASALPPEPWTPDSLATLLDRGLDELTGGDPARLALLGFSFGGMLAVHWAAQRPDRIDRVLACAAAGIALAQPPMEAMRSWRKVEDAGERRALHRHNLRAWMLHHPDSADDLAAEIAQYSVERDRLRNREVSNSATTLHALPRVRCPVDFVYGAEDVLYRHAQPQVERALRDAGAASFHWLPGAGHWLMFEQPDRFHALALPALGA